MKSLSLASILFLSLSASAVTIFHGKDVENMTCVQTGSHDSGLKGISLVTQPNGKMRARVEVAIPNAPKETFSYAIRRLPSKNRVGEPVVYRAALGRFELNICRTCTPAVKNSFSSTVNLRVPKKAKFHPPSTQLSFKDVACTLL